MIIEYFGDDKLPALMLIHEGGLGAWMWRPVIERLKQDYWVLTPVLDGHGPDAGHDFATIAQCAGQIERFIQSRLRGQKLYLAGCGPVSYTHLDVYKRQLLLSLPWGL